LIVQKWRLSMISAHGIRSALPLSAMQHVADLKTSVLDLSRNGKIPGGKSAHQAPGRTAKSLLLAGPADLLRKAGANAGARWREIDAGPILRWVGSDRSIESTAVH
jgi:hypothetical protein